MRVARSVHQQVGLAGELHPSLHLAGIGRPVERRRTEPDMGGQIVAGIAVDPGCLIAHRQPEGVQPPHQRGQDVVTTVGEDEPQIGVAPEDTLDDQRCQVHEVVQRHEGRVAGIGVGVTGERGRIVDAVASVDMHGDRKPVRRSGFPDRLEHRFAVGLARLHRNTDLHQLGMCGETLDLGDRTLGILRVDPDGAAEPVRGIGFQPPVQQPVVDRGTDSAVEQIVGDVAAGQRVQHRVIDLGIVEQVAGNGLGV